jgi:hypothetical protein
MRSRSCAAAWLAQVRNGTADKNNKPNDFDPYLKGMRTYNAQPILYTFF